MSYTEYKNGWIEEWEYKLEYAREEYEDKYGWDDVYDDEDEDEDDEEEVGKKMANLLTETKTCLRKNGHSIFDIVWVGTSHYRIDIDEFFKLADVEYDNGYGSQKVAVDLIVVGKDWYMERHEYNGAEWWEFKSIPQMPSEVKQVGRIVSDGGETLDKMNGV